MPNAKAEAEARANQAEAAINLASDEFENIGEGAAQKAQILATLAVAQAELATAAAIRDLTFAVRNHS